MVEHLTNIATLERNRCVVGTSFERKVFFTVTWSPPLGCAWDEFGTLTQSMHNSLCINGFVRFSLPTAEKCELCLAVGTNLVAIGMDKQTLITNIT